MNPLITLRQLINKPVLQTSGSIIEVLPNQNYRVRSVSGALEVKAAGNVNYQLGDEVLIRDGLIQGRIKNINSIPVYDV